MATEKPVILYDIPSRDPKTCWSWNVWKARFTLNYKGIKYETEWTEYPDIQPTLKEHFPNTDEFTCPTVKLPDGSYIMDSKLIAEHFEKAQPSPPLRMDSPYVESIRTPLRELLIPLQPVYLYLVPTRLLGDASIPYFRSTREKNIGKTLEDMHDEAIDGVWERATPAVHKIVAALNENEGPFLEGETVGYADFMLGGVLLTLKCLGNDIWDEVIKASPDGGKAILAFLKGLEPWSRAT